MGAKLLERRARGERQRRIIAAAIEKSQLDCSDLSRAMGRPPGFLSRYVQTGCPQVFREHELALLSYALQEDIRLSDEPALSPLYRE